MSTLDPDRQLGYRDRLYSSYVSSHFGAVRELDYLRDAERAYFDGHFRRWLPVDRRAAIVDVGCGHGSLLRYLHEQGYPNTVGIDVSKEQVEAARQLGLKCVKHGNAEEYLQCHRDTVDVIFALDLLEHLTRNELLGLLAAAWHALKPGGRLVIQTVNADGPFFGRIRYGDLTHEQAYTATSIAQALRACGFTGISVVPIEPTVHGVRSAARWLLWRWLRLMLTSYLAAETGVARGHVLSQNLIAVARR